MTINRWVMNNGDADKSLILYSQINVIVIVSYSVFILSSVQLRSQKKTTKNKMFLGINEFSDKKLNDKQESIA